MLIQAPLIFYTALHLAGPDLTPETFRDGLFRFPSAPTEASQIHFSWGHHGIWPTTDYFGADDATLIWWNPDAKGIDELGNDGTGLWEFAEPRASGSCPTTGRGPRRPCSNPGPRSPSSGVPAGPGPAELPVARRLTVAARRVGVRAEHPDPLGPLGVVAADDPRRVPDRDRVARAGRR